MIKNKERLMYTNLLIATLALPGWDAGAQDSTRRAAEPDEVLDEVVVSGTLKEVSKLESPVPVEVYTASFFKSNPTPSIFDALQQVNGVRPQINCNICNTGDIHINGLEGAYTMVLIDGMPVVSGLSTVYGLSGIPQSLIERVEIVKGPASTLYGSEAVAGLINIITREPEGVAAFSADAFVTSQAETNVDLAASLRAGQDARSLLGVNYFNYRTPVDGNSDGFTDVTLQHRVSLFNKWDLSRDSGRVFSFAGRYVYEDRWGGEMEWERADRGKNDRYGESIYTSRWELFGNYQLPVRERLLFRFSANGHRQNSMYGITPYLARQYVAFGQLTWNKVRGRHDLLAGLTGRLTSYNDNTPATGGTGAAGGTGATGGTGPTAGPGGAGSAEGSDGARGGGAALTWLPGAFLQDEFTITPQNKLLAGLRYDHHSIHGSILTPRLSYKWNSADKNNVLRLSVGNGYRVANVFTEDHAALTGARDVVFVEDLRPETSWNGNINFVRKIFMGSHTFLGLDATLFYTRFNNKIIADYDTDPDKIIYGNLDGFAVSKGVSVNADLSLDGGLKVLAGATLMDVYSKNATEKVRQQLTERFSGVWNVGYRFRGSGLKIDYTGNIYGPMRLPLLSGSDPRSAWSPWWSIQNIQLSLPLGKGLEVYGGVKNLLNWKPGKGEPFLIARSHDPFDQQVRFDEQGQAMITPENPYGLTFDPAYVYGPNQGLRGFLGVRFTAGAVTSGILR